MHAPVPVVGPRERSLADHRRGFKVEAAEVYPLVGSTGVSLQEEVSR